MVHRVVVIGADAAGMSSASQLRRWRPDPADLSLVVFERQGWTSYSACGIPYWLAGDLAGGPEQLVARTPEQHRANGIDLRLRHEVVDVDLDGGAVRVRDLDGGREWSEPFDDLVVATGAVPRRPDVPGIRAAGVHGLQTLDDATALDQDLRDSGARRAVVVGGGYIGIEAAEALCRRGLDVTVVDAAPHPMSTLDPDMGALVERAMVEMGIDVRTDAPLLGIETDPSGRVASVATRGGDIAAGIVVLGLGVQPNTALLRGTSLVLGASGGVRTDDRQRAVGRPQVWAGGDCVESFDRVARRHVHAPLGTHANKQGRVIGVNLGGGYLTFPGIVGTAISRVCSLEVSRTGLRERDAAAAGLDFLTAAMTSSTIAGYLPGSREMRVKVIAERRTGRLLGVQIVGGPGSAKRIDAAAVALWNGMTVEEVASLDLAYAPPFSPVWDPVLIAARKAADLVAADHAAIAPTRS